MPSTIQLTVGAAAAPNAYVTGTVCVGAICGDAGVGSIVRPQP
jgi:hypothetical protein